MTAGDGEDRLLVQPFLTPPPLVAEAYQRLDLAVYGTPEEVASIGDPQQLPRPWEPATCTGPDLRRQLWEWLDAVVIWHNQQHVWDVHALIPACWPHHPHLIHEIALLADQRHRAGLNLDSSLIADWQYHTLPGFHDRLLRHLRDHCLDRHQPSPSRGRHNRHTSRHRQCRSRARLQRGPTSQPPARQRR